MIEIIASIGGLVLIVTLFGYAKPTAQRTLLFVLLLAVLAILLAGPIV